MSTAPLGIVDTLSAGFATVNRRLWLLLLPILLDLLLTFGPGVGLAPVVESSVALFRQPLETREAGARPGLAQENLRQMLEQSAETVGTFRDANVLGLLAWQIPSLVSATSTSPLPKLRGAAVTELDNGWVLLGYGLALCLLSLLGASVYLAALAHALRSDSRDLARLGRSILRGWISFSMLFALLLLLALPASGAALLLLGAASLLGSVPLSLASSLLLAVALTGSFYLFFASDAIFYTDRGPVRSAWYSANVVWRNFWPSAGFILLLLLIQTGIPLAWKLVLEHPLGLLSAIVGQAYISTGLAAAAMLFFAQRYATWRTAARARPPSASA
ncbi:MAG: hypothetical protein HYY02_04525 [Chloroflexi bacterium]|nr:hypothetical protein [Chloroflexota bacterium]